MPAKPMALAEIAESSGFLMADVAFLAGLEESTVSRLWDNPQWLDRISGRSLQSIVSVLPGVAEYVLGFTLADRRSRLAAELGRGQVEVNEDVFRRLSRSGVVPEQYLSNALDAATSIIDGDPRRAASYLARFWGRDQDFALSFLFGTHDAECIIVDTEPLIQASIDIIEQLESRRSSFHALVAQANLMHHVSRATDADRTTDLSAVNRQSALAFRSTVMGRLISTNDQELAARYALDVESTPLLSLVEGWAFPTYTHDAKLTSDFSLPRSLLLRATAEEIIREISGYNDAYLTYLAKTAIPTVIARDGTFGMRRAELATALRARVALCEAPEAQRACEQIIRDVESSGPNTGGKGASFDHVW